MKTAKEGERRLAIEKKPNKGKKSLEVVVTLTNCENWKKTRHYPKQYVSLKNHI